MEGSQLFSFGIRSQNSTDHDSIESVNFWFGFLEGSFEIKPNQNKYKKKLTTV